MKKIFGIISYIVSFVLLILYILIDVGNNIDLSSFGRLVLLIGSCVFMYVGGLIFSKIRKDNHFMKINLYIFMGLYLLLFITLTLFDPMYNRNGLTFINWSFNKLKLYIENSFNIIPFHTIIDYTKKLFTYNIDPHIVYTNLLGNFVCLMPLGFFITLLDKKHSIKRLFIECLVFILGIEIIQFLTISGSCDIDDVILNVSGALVFYLLVNIKCINNLIRRVFLLEKNKLDIKKNIIIFSIIIFICILCVIGMKAFNNKYNNFIYNLYNFDLKIIDETDICAEALEMFYEDKYHKYYFNCIKSDNVYAVVNGEKYLVKDLLYNNPTPFNITIDTLQSHGLNYIVEDKYPSIKVSHNNDSSVNVSSSNIVEIIPYLSETDMNNTIDHYYVVPRNNGTDTIKVNYEGKQDIYNVEVNDQEVVLTKK